MNVTLVAPYPRTRLAHGEEGLGGVASYTSNLAHALASHASVSVIAPGDGARGERDDGPIRVRDVPRRGAAVARALDAASRDDDVDVLHVQFEQHLFGGALQNARLALALRNARRRKRVVVTFHQVPDLRDVDARFLKENGFPPLAAPARAWMRFQYRFLASACDRLVVHADVLGQRLREQYGVPGARIETVPHGVEPAQAPMSQAEARAHLELADKTTVLYFGYVTGYKGVDVLADAVETLSEEDRASFNVVVAGKVPARKLANPAFRESVETLEARLKSLAPCVTRRGFLSQKEISLHLAAADVVVFPYKQVFGASGPFALTVGHGRPFLASEAFRGVIPSQEALFPCTAKALADKLLRFRADAEFRRNVTQEAHRLREETSWPAVATRTRACYANAVGGAAP